MDNLGSHKVAGVVELIRSAGAEPLYLPPYSPDFNPIEKMWSKLKALFRKLKLRSAGLLSAAIPTAFETISSEDACVVRGCVWLVFCCWLLNLFTAIDLRKIITEKGGNVTASSTPFQK